MELVELVRGAQDAMERGDYRLATTAGAHGLAAFPSCLAAHRILGEAHLELGDTVPATEHFEQTLAVDPLNVVARLGLGVAAEEQKDYGTAYAHYLQAWEINPALDQVRDELVRLRGLLGVEDRLHPTRAGLAGIHARAGQLHRAANEWRAVLVAEPESRRARTSFAELLWRQGEDALAAVACHDALRGSPENARALAILADVERRRKGPAASDFAQRYRAVDPTGDVLGLLSEWRADVDLSFLTTESAVVDDFDFTAHAVPADQLGAPTKIPTSALAGNQIAAPDLWDTLVKDLSTEPASTGMAPTLAAGVEPFAWNDAGSGQDVEDPFADLGIQPFSMVDLDPTSGSSPPPFSFAEPPPDRPEVPEADIQTSPSKLTDTVQPFTSEPVAQTQPVGADDGLALLFSPASDQEVADAIPSAPEDAPSAQSFSLETGADLVPQLAGVTDGGAGAGFDDLADLGIVPFSFDEMPAPAPEADMPTEAAPHRQLTEAPPAAPVAEQTVASGAATVPARDAVRPAFDDPFVSADGTIDLTAGWDSLDSSLAAATPSLESIGEYDALAAELDMDGIVPFDGDIAGEDDDAWAPLTDDDLGIAAPAALVATPPTPPSRDTVLDDDLTPAVADWAFEPAPAARPELSTLEALMALPTIEPLVFGDDPDEKMAGSDAVVELVSPAASGTFDAEVISGIPLQQASGYTELLRHVDSEELDVAVGAEVDPFANPDSSGHPLAFEDLLAVTSRDGTAPLVDRTLAVPEQAPSPFDFSETDTSQAMPAASDGFSVVDLRDLDLESFEPFSVEEIEAPAAIVDLESLVAAETVPSGAIDPVDMLFLADQMPIDKARLEVEPFSLDAITLDIVDDGVGMTADATTDAELEPAFAPFDFEAALAEPELELDANWAEPEADWAEPVAATSAPLPALAIVDEDRAPEWSGPGGLGVTIERVVWPAFINQTSDLIDRDMGNGSIFPRVRVAKAAMVTAGGLTVDRWLTPTPPMPIDEPPLPIDELPMAPAPVSDAPSGTVAPSGEQRPAMSEQTRLDLMAMRVRLIEDADSADEIARSVEKAVGEGLSDPLALRILGEAYLKLGRMEQAAAQFRQAMLARQRSR